MKEINHTTKDLWDRILAQMQPWPEHVLKEIVNMSPTDWKKWTRENRKDLHFFNFK